MWFYRFAFFFMNHKSCNDAARVAWREQTLRSLLWTLHFSSASLDHQPSIFACQWVSNCKFISTNFCCLGLGLSKAETTSPENGIKHKHAYQFGQLLICFKLTTSCNSAEYFLKLEGNKREQQGEIAADTWDAGKKAELQELPLQSNQVANSKSQRITKQCPNNLWNIPWL